MEQDEYVEPLTGEEIINDILDQVERKLRGDCNLRDTDAYTGGYDGTVDIRVRLRGLDTAEVNRTVIVGAPATALADATGTPAEETTVEETAIEAHLEIPLEERLNLVRERSGQGIPTVSKDENGQTVIKKRRYARKDTAATES